MREKAQTSILLIAVGFVTLLAQVVLLREILVASFGSELIYLLAIGVQMLGTACGAVASRRGGRSRIATLFIALAVAIPMLVVLARSLRLIFRATPGAYLPFGQQIVAITIALLPAGILGGMLFTSAARMLVDRSGTLADAYAIESIGGVAGGAASTILVALDVQNWPAALLCAIVAASAALFGIPAEAMETPRRSIRAIAATLVVVLASALADAKRADRALTAINHPQLLASRDTPYGRTTVTGSLGQVAVFQNDALAFESEGTSAEEFVHVAALQVVSPSNVLVLGGAVEGLVPEVLKHHPLHVSDVEVDRRLIELATPFLGSTLQKSLRAPGVLTFEEPRRFLQRQNRYDLILSAMPEPDSGQASRFYTREFFAMCARRLSPGGVFAFRLRSSENLWTPALARRTASIVGALRPAFAHILVLPGAVNIILASNGGIETDPQVLTTRLMERQIEARLVSPAWLRYVYTNDRLAEIEQTLALARAPANTDARPVCYRYTLVLWLARFFPTLALNAPLQPHRSAALWAGAAVPLMAILARRRSRTVRRSLLVAFAGFAGIVLESSILLGYQIGRGVLYRDLGILVTMFMAGLAAGSWMIGRRAEAIRMDGGRTGLVVLLASAMVACLTAWSASAASLAAAAALLIAAGLTTGAIFGFASLHRVDDDAAVVAPLYAADLLGGVAGSIAASLFLIPFLGLAASALVIAILAIVALVLV